MFVAMVLSASAQYYMHVWSDGATYSMPVLNVDSVTFTDGPLENVPNEPQEPSQGIGVFSVGEGKTVTFSPGNLQYHPKNDVWRFAENQWDCVGEAGNNMIASDYNGWIDLFGWGTGNAPLKTSQDCNDYQSFVDWGTNKIGNDTANTWRTLCKDEWVYIFYHRPNAQSLFALGTVEGNEGVIVLPDNWEAPNGVDFVASNTQGLIWTDSHYENIGDYSDNTYTINEWLKMEYAGAVFLPAAGVREHGYANFSGYNGVYWTSSANGGEMAYHVHFNWDWLYPQSSYYNHNGNSVRLVKDVEGESAEPGTPPTNVENGHEYVDLGLSVKWATMNVGANAPEEYGNYFAWGEVEPKESYTLQNYKWCDGTYSGMQKYLLNGLTTLELEDDAANVNWGASWRTPTHEEWNELRTQCTWTPLTSNGISGYKISGLNGNSIFLPYGELWSSSLYTEGSSSYLVYGNRTSVDGIDRWVYYRDAGLSVRPVLDEQLENPSTPEEPSTPTAGVGVFSVSASRTVTFSPGNLQYHPKNDVWRFAEHQSISLDSANLNIAPDYDGWLDLFGWSGSTGPAYGVSSSLGYIYTGYFVDWGTNVIGNHAPNTWRTLSIYEWEYILFERDNASSLHFGAIVNGKHGRVLLPDNWEEIKPSNLELKDEYTINQWAELETLGAVFLPAGGDRTGDFQLMNYQNWGGYWTSTTESYDCNWAYEVSVSSYSIILNYSTHILRRTGLSVRLVKDLTNSETNPDNTENGYEYVDLGLTVKWATCNVGANAPEEYGDYFAWGEVEPKEKYTWENYKWCQGNDMTLTKYCKNEEYGYNGFTDYENTLYAEDDVAKVKWGGAWRMPTDKELEELIYNCTWIQTNQHGVEGYKVIGYNGNNIFIPCAGRLNETIKIDEGIEAEYWSNSLESYRHYNYYHISTQAYSMSSSFLSTTTVDRFLGLPIRPVCE